MKDIKDDYEYRDSVVATHVRDEDPYTVYPVVFLHDEAIEEIVDKVVERLQRGVEQSGSSLAS